MKNFTLLFFAIYPFILNAQYPAPARVFGEGQVDIQVALGIFPTYIADRPESIMPPVHLGVRWLRYKYLSLGAFSGYSQSQSRDMLLLDSIRGSWVNQTWFLGLESGIHYTRLDNWDLYGGLTLLYQHVWLNASSPEFEKALTNVGIKNRQGRATITAFVGSRFALSSRYNVFAELGYGVSLLKVGMGVRL
jgi:hypothetical protein